MNELLIYILKVSLINAILYAFYWLFLRRNSFHSLNRAVLLSIIPFSLICPLIKVSNNTVITYNHLDLSNYNDFFISGEQTITKALSSSNLGFSDFLLYIYCTGCIIFFVHFVCNISKLIRLKRSANYFKMHNFVFIESDKINAPFSFFRWIFLPKFFSDIASCNSIVEHEKVHSRQMHSLDLILSEAFCIAFWFNPFVFLLKRSLKTTHEYIADNEVIKNGIPVENYLLNLISAVEMSCISGITNHFKGLTIKKRIIMITKNKTNKQFRYVYLLVIPLVAIVMVAFSGNNSKLLAQTVAQVKLENIPNIQPVKNSFIPNSSKFGMRIDPFTKVERMHSGVDFPAKIGTEVLVAADGKVIQVEYNKKTTGKVIVIQHNSEYSTLYSHLDAFNVKVGDNVKKGDIIGFVGSTGRSTGTHLHYEVIKKGQSVNPQDYLPK